MQGFLLLQRGDQAHKFDPMLPDHCQCPLFGLPQQDLVANGRYASAETLRGLTLWANRLGRVQSPCGDITLQLHTVHATLAGQFLEREPCIENSDTQSAAVS